MPLSQADAISNTDYKAATDILDIISPLNDLEYYRKLTSQIYIRNIRATGVFDLSDEDACTLRGIAELNGAQFGPGVFYAMGMLDTIIEHNKEKPAARFRSNVHEGISIAPNPASNYIYISGEVAELYELEIYSTIGEKIFTKENIISYNQIILPKISTGVYLIVIKNKGEIIKSEKLIIF
ncbi:MAG: T9SS type A sorting domain-containing protein [Chitinophagales bacterium]